MTMTLSALWMCSVRVRCDTAAAHKVKVVKQKHTIDVVQTSGIETEPKEKIPNHTRLMEKRGWEGAEEAQIEGSLRRCGDDDEDDGDFVSLLHQNNNTSGRVYRQERYEQTYCEKVKVAWFGCQGVSG